MGNRTRRLPMNTKVETGPVTTGVMRRDVVYHFKPVASPVGELRLVTRGQGLCAVLWENEDPSRVPMAPLVETADLPILEEAARQLCAYFAGQLREFTLPL